MDQAQKLAKHRQARCPPRRALGCPSRLRWHRIPRTLSSLFWAVSPASRFHRELVQEFESRQNIDSLVATGASWGPLLGMCRARPTAEATSGDIRAGLFTTGLAARTRSMAQFAIDGYFWVRKPASWVTRLQTSRERPTVSAD